MKDYLLVLIFSFLITFGYCQNNSNRLPFNPPEYQGGTVKLLRFLSKNVKYPKSAKREKAEGVVYVSFIVKTSGTLDSIIVLQGIRPDLDKEAIRVVKKMPKWKPGTNLKGEPIPMQYKLPIRFKLKTV